MLKISSLTDYGLLATVYLARKAGEVVAAREIAGFYHLSLPMITKVLKTLHAGGIVQSYRGSGAGIHSMAIPTPSRSGRSSRRSRAVGPRRMRVVRRRRSRGLLDPRRVPVPPVHVWDQPRDQRCF